jgi:hypothetical protein
MRLRLAILLLTFSGASYAVSQEATPPTGGSSPLGIRQQRIERMMDELQEKFKSLKLALQDNEPQQAERLQLALNTAKELLIQKRMDDVARLLDESRLDAADDGQKAVLKDIRTLLALLLEEKGGRELALEEFERLTKWKERIETLIQAENGQRRESEHSTADSPQAFEKRARNQDDLANQTHDLDRQMQQAESPIGRPQVAEAHQSMRQASTDLRKQDPRSAAQQQSRAITELEEALRQIDERLRELQPQVRAEKLARLEERFQQMLATQQQLTEQTTALEQKRTAAGGQLNRADRNAVRAVGEAERRMDSAKNDAQAKETGLAGQAQQALEMLDQDAANVVFLRIIEQLRDDLIAVGNLLADNLRTDQHTTSGQSEIETTLEELIAILQQVQQQKSGDSTSAESERGDSRPPSLLPTSAELKLLRAAQMHINRQTAALDEARPKSGLPGDALTAAVRCVGERQAAIAELTAQILNRGR